MSTNFEITPVKYQQTIGIVNNGLNGRGFANPYDLGISQKGDIFVLNRCDVARREAIRIGVCNRNEDYLYEFGYGFGNSNGQLALPVSMVLGSNDDVFVSDEHNHRITIFNKEGIYLNHWGEQGSGPAQFNSPSGIALDKENAIYVSDQKNHRIQKYTREGTFIDQWGEPGSNDGQFDLPWGLTIDQHRNVLVADWRNDRVQIFDSCGNHLRTIGTTGSDEQKLKRPSGVAVNSEGTIYVADWGNERVQAFDPEGTHLFTLMGEATLSKWAIDFFSSNPDEMATRKTADLISELPSHLNSPYHRSSQTEPYFWGPVSVRTDDQDRLYVVESNRHRIQIYEPVS